MNNSVKEKRCGLIARLFPKGIPKLLCPPLTHYTEQGDIDFARIEAHLAHLSQWVKTYLIPGSTGDGWEMNEEEIQQVLGFDLELAEKLDVQILIGVLRTDAEAARKSMVDTLAWLKNRGGIENDDQIMEKTKVCGFTVCPPKGKDVSQAQIYSDLVPILELAVPTALYQLPQVTENEMSGETVAKLAAEFSNFYLLKDTSGGDKVALSGLDLGGVYLVRGAEGDYSKWLRTGGGSYDGFLLGSANCFAKELNSIIENVCTGNLSTAEELSARITGVVDEVFKCAAGLGASNLFSYAYKAVDHFFAYGPDAAEIAPPRIYSGERLEAGIIKTAGEALTRFRLMPSEGYLSTEKV
jgi:dihydrodipicolinate synthase/N-acetylneuraminate lyase